MRAVFVVLLLAEAAFGQTRLFEREVQSPDGRITLLVSVADSIRLAVRYAGQPLMQPSPMAMTLGNGQVLGLTAKVQRSHVRTVRDSILAPVATKRRVVHDHYVELSLEFNGNYTLEFRAYNDGVAYRFRTTLPDSITVRDETARFVFANNPTVYYPAVQPRTDADRFHTSFEEPYQIRPLNEISDTTLCFSPVLVTSASGPRVVLTESDLLDYPGMFLARAGISLKGVFAPYPLAERMTTGGEFPQAVVTRRADFIARTTGRRTFPWRVLVIGQDRDLPASDLVYRLATPSRLTDVSWIRPGKCTDEWITNINLFNVPFRAGINTATYKYYVDFAKRFGFDRILLDAGWSDYQDLFKITPGLDMPELVAYARSQGVRLSMWTLAATLDRQLEPALNQFQAWGVDFIMTDFMDRDDQKMVNFYTRVADACAKAKIMIMFHGAYKPAGFERTYPHAITREGVLGSEYNIWSRKATPDHDVLLPFIRMVSGPMDYEPGLLNNATKEQFRPIAGQVMSQGTRCHQLAMFVVYDSPIPIFSGNPSQAMLEPRFMDFLGSLPTTYDETRILDAQLGEYIVTARQTGNGWTLGGLTNWSARDLVLPLGFLANGPYEVIGCLDGPNADRNPVDYQFMQQTIARTDSLRLHLAPGGGFLVRIRRK
ncbi:glycoside hydrolase family 97 protein [Spirosoma taeanense]|uniref:Glycoside hydrolase family 97 protein n=1 Tax=Spirosoma taeanense TaxID=2735870 RepID=A0A6M5YDU1_9BACT|nr:glycoside hydrolase family 97 protein [Spirosoma taeanense]QJW91774.1 glycoside hydrolase family 97 protein [Spirosoma taeanense]